MRVTVGIRHAWQTTVTREMLADQWGNAGVPVLSTPHLVGLFEKTAYLALRDALDIGEASLGTLVNIRHTKATPLGAALTLSAEVVRVEGQRVTFAVRAEDAGGLAGEGEHERYVVDLARFLARVYLPNPPASPSDTGP